MNRVSTGWRCPVDPGHGTVIPLSYPGRWGWYCPHEAHDGWRETPRSRAFFTTSEVESGLLDSPEPPVNAEGRTPAALEPPAARTRSARRSVPPAGRRATPDPRRADDASRATASSSLPAFGRTTGQEGRPGAG